MRLTPEDLQRRRGGLGGSDAPRVFDVGFGSPMELWVDKVFGYDIKPTARMQRGHDLEPLIAEKAAAKLGLKNLQPGGWVDHPEHPWMFTNLDYTTHDGEIDVECKAIEFQHKGHEWGPDGDPDGCALYVQLQVMHQLETSRADMSVVAVLFVDTWELRTYEIKPDHDLQQRMVEGEHRFWHAHVVPQIPPPLTDAQSAWDALRSINHRPDSAVDLPPDTRELIARYVETRQRRLDISKDEQDLRAQLAWLLGEHEHGLIDGEVAVRFTSSAGSRRLSIPSSYQKEHINGH